MADNNLPKDWVVVNEQAAPSVDSGLPEGWEVEVESPREDPRVPLARYLGETAQNIPSSAWNLAAGFIQGLPTALKLAAGPIGMAYDVSKVNSSRENRAKSQEKWEEQGAAMREHYKQRYGGLQNIADTVREDPVGVAADVATVAGIGSPAVRPALRIAEKAAQAGARGVGRAGSFTYQQPQVVTAATGATIGALIPVPGLGLVPELVGAALGFKTGGPGQRFTQLVADKVSKLRGAGRTEPILSASEEAATRQALSKVSREGMSLIEHELMKREVEKIIGKMSLSEISDVTTKERLRTGHDIPPNFWPARPKPAPSTQIPSQPLYSAQEVSEFMKHRKMTPGKRAASQTNPFNQPQVLDKNLEAAQAVVEQYLQSVSVRPTPSEYNRLVLLAALGRPLSVEE